MRVASPYHIDQQRCCAGGITRLGLQNFRNYKELILQPSSRQVVLAGPNGAGKTNILEAISLLAPGKGLRNAKPTEWRRETPAGSSDGSWGIHMTLEDEQKLGTGYVPEQPNSTRRRLTHQGAKLSSQAQLAEYLAVVWLTPQMDGLFISDAAARRKFIDRLVYTINPYHASHLYRYEHALRQRNRLLKEGGHAAMIRALDPIIVSEGVAIAAARLENTQRLNDAMLEMDTPFPLPVLKWDGLIETWLQETSALDVEQRYFETLQSQLEQDRIIGQTRLGVHRSDVLATHSQKKIAASQCSTGEQKALLMALVLAHAQWLKTIDPHRPLVLLMDEVTAHLDEERRQNAFDWLESLDAQTWFTGTEAAMFSGLSSAQVFDLPFDQ